MFHNNQAAIDIASNPIFHEQTRNIDLIVDLSEMNDY